MTPAERRKRLADPPIAVCPGVAGLACGDFFEWIDEDTPFCLVCRMVAVSLAMIQAETIDRGRYQNPTKDEEEYPFFP